MDYYIVSASSTKRLVEEVVRLMKMGWICQGGVAVTREHGANEYAQAMVKQ